MWKIINAMILFFPYFIKSSHYVVKDVSSGLAQCDLNSTNKVLNGDFSLPAM
jgi:hypothetical protein